MPEWTKHLFHLKYPSPPIKTRLWSNGVGVLEVVRFGSLGNIMVGILSLRVVQFTLIFKLFNPLNETFGVFNKKIWHTNPFNSKNFRKCNFSEWNIWVWLGNKSWYMSNRWFNYRVHVQALSVATPQGPNKFPPRVQIQGVANCSLAEKLIPNMGDVWGWFCCISQLCSRSSQMLSSQLSQTSPNSNNKVSW